MDFLQEYMNEYKKIMKKGVIAKAYKGLMEYIIRLKTHLKAEYPDYFLSSNIYYGYMDMTYFSFTPESLKRLGLKVAIVFIHESCKFEIWLCGSNKDIQKKYWKKFKEMAFNKYNIVPTTQGYDSILEHILIKTPDFNDTKTLTIQIEQGSMIFIKDVENYLFSQKAT
jgi:hypothetical protein